jgi:two-component system, OmpR family, sensor histidine kinase MprB
VTLRRRLMLAGSAVVAVTVLVAAGVAYAVARHELRSQVDDVLREQARVVHRAVEHARHHDYGSMGGGGQSNADDMALQGKGEGLEEAARKLPSPGRLRNVAAYVQLIDSKGQVTRAPSVAIPVSAEARAVAAGKRQEHWTDTHSGGEHLRVLSIPVGEGGGAQVARSLGGVDDVMGRMLWVMVLLCAGGVAFAVLLTRLSARPVVRPVTDLTEAAEHVEATGDLGRRVPVEGQDEVGRLALRFNAMLDRLQGSVAAQKRLIADASHELRTPVTSLRTNIEVLRDDPELPADERRRLLDDVVAQTEELGALVADLIDLARDGESAPALEDVRLDAVVSEGVARAHRFAPGVTFETELEPTVVEGVPDRLGRAVNNLLDNAARHSPDGAVVEVRLAGGELTVRDHGEGVDPEDLPHLFDRFYRGANVRGRPGSGLGLAIVRHVAEQHGGSVSVANAVDGGAVFRFVVPATPPAA